MYGDGRGLDEPPPILARRFLLAVAVALAVLLAGETASAESRCPEGAATIPLLPGATWVYAGDVESTVWKKGDGHVIKRHVTLRMEVRAAFRRGNTTAVLVKGHPMDLAWYEPGQPRSTYLLFQQDDGAAWRVTHDLDATLQRWKDTGHIPAGSPEIAAPLRVGETWGGEEEAPSRPDKWYQWHVEQARCVALRGVPGVDGRQQRREYRLAYRTCPDDTLIYWSPGLGITRFVYSHHGTVTEADVRLIAFQPGSPDAPVERILVRTTPGARARQRGR